MIHTSIEGWHHFRDSGGGGRDNSGIYMLASIDAIYTIDAKLVQAAHVDWPRHKSCDEGREQPAEETYLP